MHATLLLLPLLAVCSTTNQERAPESHLELIVLGVAQDGGMPHVGCTKACCTRARHRHEELFPACLGIRDTHSGALVLFEATPRIEPQLALLHESDAGRHGRTPVDAIVLTHAHIGHYLGLAQLGREVASSRELPVHASPRMASFLRENGPWSQLVSLKQIRLEEFTFGKPFSPIPGLRVEAIQVPHRDEFSDTAAFKIHGPKRTVLFCPDVDSWSRHPKLLDRLLAGVDVAYIDGTFYDGSELPGRNLAEIPHPLMIDTMKQLKERARARPGSIRFIHLNHTNPALGGGKVREDVLSHGFRLARRGERLAL